MNQKFLLCSVVITIGSCIILLLNFLVVSLPIVITLISKIGIVIGGTGTLTIYGLTKYLGEERTVPILKNLVLLAIVIIFLVPISEVTTRFIFRDITTTADNSSYFARRWKKSNVHLNRFGFREREFELEKPANVYRIAVIGDSFTFGQGIAENDRFTNLLQKNLNEINIGYEILNFGKCGAETVDHIKFLEDVVLNASPDFILLQWYTNDIEGTDKSGLPKAATMPLTPSEVLNSLLHKYSVLYYLINKQWASLQSSLGISAGSYDEYMYKRFGNPNGTDTIKYKMTLKKFINLCKEREIPLGIILFPDPGSNLGKGYAFEYLHNYVIELCALEKITYIDIRSTFAKLTEYKNLRVNRFDGHPSPLANQLAAEQLMDTFGHIWLSESVSTGL